jgi:hypothetical protein
MNDEDEEKTQVESEKRLVEVVRVGNGQTRRENRRVTRSGLAGIAPGRSGGGGWVAVGMGGWVSCGGG